MFAFGSSILVKGVATSKTIKTTSKWLFHPNPFEKPMLKSNRMNISPSSRGETRPWSSTWSSLNDNNELQCFEAFCSLISFNAGTRKFFMVHNLNAHKKAGVPSTWSCLFYVFTHLFLAYTRVMGLQPPFICWGKPYITLTITTVARGTSIPSAFAAPIQARHR